MSFQWERPGKCREPQEAIDARGSVGCPICGVSWWGSSADPFVALGHASRDSLVRHVCETVRQRRSFDRTIFGGRRSRGSSNATWWSHTAQSEIPGGLQLGDTELDSEPLDFAYRPAAQR